MTQIRSKEIRIVPLDEIKLNPRNRNRHSKDQIKRLSEIIEYQGFRQPLMVSNRSGLCVAGEGRYLAAKKLKLKEVPVCFQDFDSDEQEIAAGVSDNAIALWAELDLEGINTDLGDLGPDFNIDLLGILNFKIDAAENEGLTDPDAVPETPKESPVCRGELFRLGNHRLLCGDSTSITDVERLMNGEKADMVFTSPPYNADVVFSSFVPKREGKKLYGDSGISDNLDSEKYLELCRSVLENCFLSTVGFIFWNVSYNANSRFEYILQIQDRAKFLIEQACWIKAHTLPFKGSLRRDWEPVYIFSTDGRKLGLTEVTSNVWNISNANSQHEEHKACFPVALPLKAIDLVNPKTVLEPFCGSGTTIIACEKTNRQCYGMEIDPHYCSVILDRWAAFTGKDPVRLNEDGSETPWSEIKATLQSSILA